MVLDHSFNLVFAGGSVQVFLELVALIYHLMSACCGRVIDMMQEYDVRWHALLYIVSQKAPCRKRDM